MKSLLTVFLLFSLPALFAQSKNDAGLSDFIKKNGYVQLTDTAHLPKSILPYLPVIEDNLSAQKYAAPTNVYLKLADVWDNNYQITVTIMNISEIKLIKQQYDKAQNTKDTVINGRIERLAIVSAGGGEQFKINKSDGHITAFRNQ